MAIEHTTDGGKPWRVRWRTLAGEARSRRCSDKRTAQQLDAEITRLKCSGVDWEPAVARDQPRLRDVAIAYQDARRAAGRAPDTLRVEGSHIDVFLRFAGERRVTTLDKLSRPLLDDFLGWCLRPDTGLHGRARKPGSAARIVEAVLLMWQWAEDSERFPDVPRAPRKLDLPRAIPPAVVAPTWAEMDAAVLACEGWLRHLAIWLRYTGLRCGESMRFEWAHVDMERGTLTIPAALDKNKTGRTIPLHPALLDEIATWGKREGHLIACVRRVRKASRAAFVREVRGREMADAWRAAKVREAAWKGHPDHAFRRGLKSGLLALGAHPDAVDFLQGHKLGAGSRGRYIDGWALPLRETIAMVPVIGASAGNVVPLRAGVRGVSENG